MRKAVPSAVTAALMFSIGCSGEPQMDMAGQASGHDLVPLTITMPDSIPGGGSGAVNKVEFPTIDPDTSFVRDSIRIQYKVGTVGPDTIDGRYRFTVDYYVGNSPNPFSRVMSFGPTATCDNGPTEGDLDRIACAVVEQGNNLVCSTTYDGMDNPPPQCDGTYACVRCDDGSRACGSNPQCR